MALADELHKLDQLRQSGALTDEEYAKAKAHVLEAAAQPTPAAPSGSLGSTFGFPSARPVDIEQQTRLWAMLIHLSLLAGILIPYAGYVVPIVIWQLKKNELPGIDAHGRVAANWMISWVIYTVIAFVLCFVLIGIPLLLVLAILHIVFPIIGAVKANEGELWQYPLSIKFFWVE